MHKIGISSTQDIFENFEMQDLNVLRENRATLREQLEGIQATFPEQQESGAFAFAKAWFGHDLETKKSAISKMILSLPKEVEPNLKKPEFNEEEISFLNTLDCIQEAKKLKALPLNFIKAEQAMFEKELAF